MSASKKKKKDTPKPTEAELELLRVLWDEGPNTVGEIHKARAGQGTGYTTTLKLLQRMTEKGLVQRDESQHAHVYRAAISAENTQRQLVRDLLQRAFGGSPLQLVVQALSEKKASSDDLSTIRKLIDEMEQQEKTKPKKKP